MTDATDHTVVHADLDELMKEVRSRLATHVPKGGIRYREKNFEQDMKPLDTSVFYSLFYQDLLVDLPPEKMFGLFGGTKRTAPPPALNRTLRTRLFRSRLS